MTRKKKSIWNRPLEGRLAHGPEIICPNANCGYRGLADRKDTFSVALLLILCLLFLLPGLIYLVVGALSKPVISCPRCGMRVR